MQLSTKARYALRGVLDLLESSDGKNVRLMDIANRQDISLAYLENI